MLFRSAEATGRRGRREGSADTKQTIELLLHSGDVLGKAAAKLHESLKAFTREVAEQKKAQEAEAAQGAVSAESKFGGGPGYELTFGRQVQFYLGLEGLIGCPAGGSAEEVVRAMQREHCEMEDRHAQVYAGNYGNCTFAELEWHFVTDEEQYEALVRQKEVVVEGETVDEVEGGGWTKEIGRAHV